jgi:hypothetical protein
MMISAARMSAVLDNIGVLKVLLKVHRNVYKILAILYLKKVFSYIRKSYYISSNYARLDFLKPAA